MWFPLVRLEGGWVVGKDMDIDGGIHQLWVDGCNDDGEDMFCGRKRFPACKLSGDAKRPHTIMLKDGVT